MKKITVALLIVLFAISCIFCSCGQNYSWEDALTDISKLKDAQFVVYNEDTEEIRESGAKILNKQLKDDGYDFTVELVHQTSLYEDMSCIISFSEYATEKQAQQLFDYYMEMDTPQKFVRFGKILIHTNSTKAEELLGYDFITSSAYTEW